MMERWKAILLILMVLGCFVVAGLLEDPNDYHLVPEQQKIAANHGYYMISDGHGNFHYIPMKGEQHAR
jgi:hypothetical protein